MEVIGVVRSMTGYGRGECVVNGTLFRVEIRSVNHRYLDVVVRMPREFLRLEEKIKKEVQSTFTRGRLDVFVTIDAGGGGRRQAEIDWGLAEQVIRSVRALKERFGLVGELSVSDVVHIPDVLAVQEVEENVEEWEEPLLRVVREASAALLEMRQSEGAELTKDVLKRLERIQLLVASIREQAPKVVEDYRERIAARAREYVQDLDIDEGRLLTEVVLYADRSNIEEELTRLDSHCKQFEHILSQDSPNGRKLDFLVQEMNRETNTVGSKANDLAISQAVVEIKSELEKIREQVQNFE